MKKSLIIGFLGLGIFTSCGEKKDVCTCMKEATQIMIDKGFDVDPDKPEYSEGCEYLSEMSQEEIDNQLDEACQDEIMKMIFGDFDFDNMDFDDMNPEPVDGLEQDSL